MLLKCTQIQHTHMNMNTKQTHTPKYTNASKQKHPTIQTSFTHSSLSLGRCCSSNSWIFSDISLIIRSYWVRSSRAASWTERTCFSISTSISERSTVKLTKWEEPAYIRRNSSSSSMRSSSNSRSSNDTNAAAADDYNDNSNNCPHKHDDITINENEVWPSEKVWELLLANINFLLSHGICFRYYLSLSSSQHKVSIPFETFSEVKFPLTLNLFWNSQCFLRNLTPVSSHQCVQKVGRLLTCLERGYGCSTAFWKVRNEECSNSNTSDKSMNLMRSLV